jgi:hypothetical protein
VRFDSLEAEVNFVALLSLVELGGGYRAELHKHAGEGAHGFATRALLGAFLAVRLPSRLPLYFSCGGCWGQRACWGAPEGARH